MSFLCSKEVVDHEWEITKVITGTQFRQNMSQQVHIYCIKVFNYLSNEFIFRITKMPKRRIGGWQDKDHKGKK